MKFFYLFLLLFVPYFTFSQYSINGIITDSKSNPLASAIIILKDSTNKNIISHTFTNKAGFFEINNLNEEGVYFISANSLGSQKKFRNFFLSKSKITQIVNFQLQTDEVLIQEIVVSEEAMPIRVKKDTVIYNVSKFTDGTEEVIEDVLKKLPGIEISEQGNITYKGKSIEKVLIEGDDLFDKNYTIATKNISSEVISKVQAIENYSENEKLHGIYKSNKSVLNIELKEDVKTKPYGRISASYGFKNKYDASTNLIGITKKIKYYLLGSSNNIGTDLSPSDAFSANQKSESNTDLQLIKINFSVPNIKFKRVNINHSFLASSNFLFKPSKKLKIKSNFFFSQNNNTFLKKSNIVYHLDNKNLTLFEEQNLQRTKNIGEGQLKVDYNLSESAAIKYKGNIRLIEADNLGQLYTSEKNFSEKLYNEGAITYQKLQYTKRITKTNALLINTNFSFYEKPQEYTLIPDLNSLLFENENSLTEKHSIIQKSTISQREFDFSAKLIRFTKRRNSSLTVGYVNIFETLNSKNHSNKLSNYNNGGVNENNLIFINVINKYQFKKLKIKYGASLNFRSFNFQDLNLQSKNNIIYISPKIVFDTKITENNSILFSYSFDKSPVTITDLYSDYILTDYRTFSKGLSNNLFIQNHLISTNFAHSNWFNQFTFYTQFTFLINDKSIGSKILINDTLTFSEKEIVPGIKNYIANTGISKFIPILSTTIKLNSSLFWFKYFNYIENSELRQNLLFSSSFKLALKTAFKSKLNVEAKINYKNTSFKTSNLPDVANSTNINLGFNIIIKPSKKWFVYIKTEQLMYNIGENNSQIIQFIDIESRYIAKKNKLNFNLSARNLLNVRNFNVKAISDYYSNETNYSIIARHFLCTVSFRF